MPSQSALYSEQSAQHANLTREVLGLPSWESEDVKALQAKVGASPVDGWLGPKSIEAWKTWARQNKPNPVVTTQGVHPGQVIINGAGYTPPLGLKVVNFSEPGGIPAQLEDTSPRKADHGLYQFVLHRGAEGRGKNENYAQATERVLDSRGLSTTFSMDVDGTVYEHFDPAIRRGRHCTYHNVQSDSLDIGGPFSLSKTGVPGQEKISFQVAIGRSGDGKPPLARGYATQKCWSLTPAQKTALILFVPWWCNLRGIPLTACEDWRCFRLSRTSERDPVTHVKGILGHAQISDPGKRVDGILPLITLRESKAPIQWRTGEDFFKT